MLEHQQCMLAAIITLHCCRLPKPLFSRPDNQETGMYTQVIFDSRSQRSYITSKTGEQLKLPTVGKETLLIKTFGDNSASVKECDIVQLCIRTIDAMSVYATTYAVPVIYSTVSNQEIQSAVECYPYLQGLQLSCGTVNRTVSVDLLIGVDHYWSFFTGGIIRGDPSCGVFGQRPIHFKNAHLCAIPNRVGRIKDITVVTR